MRFLYFFITTLLTGLTYLYIRFISTLRVKKSVRYLLFAGAGSVFFLIFYTIYLKRTGVTGFFPDLLGWVSYTAIGFLSFIFTLLVIRDFFLGIIWMAKKASKLLPGNIKSSENISSPERRDFMESTLNCIITGGAFLLTGTGLYGAKKLPDVKRVELPVKNLPKSLEGFSIAQISDIHLSSTIKGDFIKKVVDKTNELSPDLIALTGDLADGIVEVMGRDADPLKELSAPHGKFFVTGNHEYYFDAEAWIDKLENLGFKVLNNAHTLVKHGKGRLLVAGVTDIRGGRFIRSHKSSPQKAIKNAPPSDLKILLAHQPKSVFEASKAGFDIQLSGHTHGGQFFPWNLAVGLDQPYVAGIYKHENTMLYVSRGTGYWGPPLRLGSPSEITFLKLVAA